MYFSGTQKVMIQFPSSLPWRGFVDFLQPWIHAGVWMVSSKNHMLETLTTVT